jgi:hypothetical protein
MKAYGTKITRKKHLLIAELIQQPTIREAAEAVLLKSESIEQVEA